jgi:flagellar motor switch protein FliM
MRILLAEDDAPLASFVRKGLEAEHYAVDISDDGEQARSLASACDYDLVILDLNLPRLDGIAVLRQFRVRKPSVPVLILTGRSRVEDRVQCLDFGADDYLIKPFSFAELSARIRALLRRSHLPSSSVLEVDDLKLDRIERTVERDGCRIELTSKEFSLLEYLMRNAGRRVTRAMIIEHVWNLAFDTATNVVDVYINYLRIAFEAALVSAEHLSYREFLQRLPEISYLASFRLSPVNTLAILQLDLGVAFPLIDLLLGGEGTGSAPSRDVTEIEERILETVARMIGRELEATWSPLKLEFAYDSRHRAAEVQRLLPLEEKTLCLGFELKMAEAHGGLNLAFPAVVSNTLLRKLARDWVYRKPHGAAFSADQMRERLRRCPFHAQLEVLGLSLPLRQVLELAPGQQLNLSRRADKPAILRVATQGLFSASAVRCGDLKAARLLTRLAPGRDEEVS